MPRTVRWVIALVLFAIGLFYAFNAYIQLQERGFAEPLDIPIAIVSLLGGAFVAWGASRADRSRPD